MKTMLKLLPLFIFPYFTFAENFFIKYGLSDLDKEIDITVVYKNDFQPQKSSPHINDDIQNDLSPEYLTLDSQAIKETNSINKESLCELENKFIENKKIISCRSYQLDPKKNPEHKYIYRTFLNFSPNISPNHLKPNNKLEALPFISPHRFLLVLKIDSAKTSYLLFHSKKKYPVAGGLVKEHYGLTTLSNILRELSQTGKKKRIVSDISLGDNSIDYYAGLGISGIIMLSSDDNANGVQNPDLNDYVQLSGIPFFASIGIRFLDVITLQLNWRESSFEVQKEVIDDPLISAWNISRTDFGINLKLGKSYPLNDQHHAYVYGFGGAGKTFYKDKIQFADGDKETGDYFLNDVPYLTFGAGTSIRLHHFIEIGSEIGALVKDFATTGKNPDGSGSEVFIRAYLNGIFRH